MKNQTLKILITLVIATFVISICLPASHAQQTTAQVQSRAFIENALPIDVSKYNITFVKESSLAMQNGEISSVRYTLTSAESTVTIICDVQNNVLRSCQISEDKGSVISDKQYINLNNAVQSFLEKYQAYTKIDTSSLAAMLDKVDLTKNTTIIAGHTKLTITNTLWAGKDLTNFNWAYTANGVDYTSLQVGFQKNGVLDTLFDDRGIYSIGDTSINVSSDQAIDIAMKNLSTYSYSMPDKTIVSDFNVTKDNIATTLASSSLNSTVLRPYWTIILPLNETYPGNVRGIQVFIWADTGKVISYGNVAYGGIDYNDNSEPAASGAPTAISSVTSSNDNPEFPSTLFAICALIVIILALGSIAVIKKTRK